MDTACGSLQLCAGIEDFIEGATHVVAQWIWERIAQALGERSDKESEEGSAVVEANNGRGEDASVVVGVVEMPAPPKEGSAMGEGRAINNLRTTMEEMYVGTEDMAEGDALAVDKDGAEVEEGGLEGGLLALESTELLTQEVEPGSTTIVDACSSFNRLSRLAMILMVVHR